MKMDLISASYNQDSDEKNLNLAGNIVDPRNEPPYYLLKETPGKYPNE